MLRRRPTPSLLEALFAAVVAGGGVLAWLAGQPVDQFLWLVLGYGLALLAVSVAAVAVLPIPRPLARSMAGLSLTFVVYGALNAVFGDLGKHAIDAPLWEMERRIFGTTLVEVVAPHASPAWTLFFSAVYSVHVPLFFLSSALHWRAGRRERALDLHVALALAMYLGFVGYVLWPAYGPVGAMAHLPPLDQNAVTALVAAEGVALGTFPSLHGGISAAVAIDGWRTSRRWGIAFTVVAALVWMSTIYLRYHWVPDLVAGLALAALSVVLAGPLRRWYDAATRSKLGGEIVGSVPVQSHPPPIPAGERPARRDGRPRRLWPAGAADSGEAG